MFANVINPRILDVNRFLGRIRNGKRFGIGGVPADKAIDRRGQNADAAAQPRARRAHAGGGVGADCRRRQRCHADERGGGARRRADRLALPVLSRQGRDHPHAGRALQRARPRVHRGGAGRRPRPRRPARGVRPAHRHILRAVPGRAGDARHLVGHAGRQGAARHRPRRQPPDRQAAGRRAGAARSPSGPRPRSPPGRS